MGDGSVALVEAVDEGMHAVEAAENFNESMYFNLIDHEAKVGGFFRLGNRPNEGHAEMTVAMYLADGSVAFMYQRPKISGNEGFDAGGLKIEVVEPFNDIRIDYSGDVLMLEDPMVLADPKAAFSDSPRSACSISLKLNDVAPLWGGELTSRDASDTSLADFWKGHYEGHLAGQGTLTIGDKEWKLQGYGLRDHSWGPRTWQSISWYRWLTANFDRDGFVLSLIGEPSGSVRVGGAMLIDGEYQPVRELEIDTDYDSQDLPTALRLRIGTDNGRYEISGKGLSTIPLRHRRQTDDGVEQSRIGETITEWTWDDRVGYGLSEYLDRLVDGRPAGVIDAG